MTNEIKSRYIYLRFCDAVGEPLYVSQYLVWDAESFISHRVKECQENRKEMKDGPAIVEAITQAEYFEFRKAGR